MWARRAESDDKWHLNSHPAPLSSLALDVCRLALEPYANALQRLVQRLQATPMPGQDAWLAHVDRLYRQALLPDDAPGIP